MTWCLFRSPSTRSPSERLDIAAVLLDMDGTLVDSDAAVDRAWRQWCAETETSLQKVREIAPGKPSATTIRQLFPAITEADIARSAARQLELQYDDLDDMVAAPGAHLLVDTLVQRGMPWAVVTSADPRLAAARLTAAGIVTQVLVTCEDTEFGKPHPQGYLLAASQLDTLPERCLVVEDSAAGVTAGLRAGMTVAGLRGAGGHIPIDELTELVPLLQPAPV